MNAHTGTTYTTGDYFHPFTDVGAYTLSESPYGTFDQGGNVFEWNDTVLAGAYPGIRGISWQRLAIDSHVQSWAANWPADSNPEIGFRVAAVPEPSALGVFIVGVLGLLRRSRRASR